MGKPTSESIFGFKNKTYHHDTLIIVKTEIKYETNKQLTFKECLNGRNTQPIRNSHDIEMNTKYKCMNLSLSTDNSEALYDITMLSNGISVNITYTHSFFFGFIDAFIPDCGGC